MKASPQVQRKDGAVYDTDRRVQRARELKVLAKIKQERAKRKFKTIQLDRRTWKEVEILTN